MSITSAIWLTVTSFVFVFYLFIFPSLFRAHRHIPEHHTLRNPQELWYIWDCVAAFMSTTKNKEKKTKHKTDRFVLYVIVWNAVRTYEHECGMIILEFVGIYSFFTVFIVEPNRPI